MLPADGRMQHGRGCQVEKGRKCAAAAGVTGMHCAAPAAHPKHTPTWLNVLPLYTPTTEPIISGTMIMLRRWVRTASGFSPAAASILALRSFLTRARGLRLRPRWNLLLRQGFV